VLHLQKTVDASAIQSELMYPKTTARFMFIGKPLPRIEDAIRVGEYFRAAVMSKAKYVLHGADNIPPALSGHDLGAGNRHGHAFYLPEDADADGRIDHILLHAPDGLSWEAQHVLSHLTLFRGRQGMEWQVVLEGIGKATDFSANSPYAKESAIWQSVTPYLRPWHLKKKPPELEQLTAFIRKECKLRGWIQNLESVERLPAITINGKARRVTRFHRFRNKRDITQPDTQGYFLRLQFSQSVSGPLALGFACHYGLGVFVPMNYCRNQAG